MTEQLFLFILLIHFLADFGLQTHDQATQKSGNWMMLSYHVGVYSLIWLLAAWAMFGAFTPAFIFAGITFTAHFITDAITSRVSKPFFENDDYHNGFVVVGFDQVLHYIQLWLTFDFVNNL